MWYEKSVPKTGARKWSRFMAQISEVCVMADMPETSDLDLI